jgi:hypothetical protein
MDVGDRCICQYEEWFNAFGAGRTMLTVGQRMTVIETRRVGGAQFLAFEETPKDNYFMADGFKPMRELN